MKKRKRRESTHPPEAKPLSRRRWLRLALILLIVALTLPALGVLLARFVNPPITPLMALRSAESWFSRGQFDLRHRHVPLRAVPNDFIRFVLVAEDQRFYEHSGFDWTQIRRARAESERTGKPPRGTSTITQQCSRSTFLWTGRSWVRKGLEAYITVWMEWLLPKERILELYVNVVEMGDGVFGIAAASEHYFGKPADQLSREECALLAGILPNPRKRDPRSPNRALLRRQAHILRNASAVDYPPRQ